MSQLRAESYDPRPTDAVISITDTGKPQANLNRGWCAELRISFDDIDPVDFPTDPEEGLVGIQEDQSRDMADFIASLPDICEAVIVHCRYGQSRSAGVARAICQHFGLHFPPDYDHFNNYVFNRVRESLRSKAGSPRRLKPTANDPPGVG